jgi:hypothetical protein
MVPDERPTLAARPESVQSPPVAANLEETLPSAFGQR